MNVYIIIDRGNFKFEDQIQYIFLNREEAQKLVAIFKKANEASELEIVEYWIEDLKSVHILMKHPTFYEQNGLIEGVYLDENDARLSLYNFQESQNDENKEWGIAKVPLEKGQYWLNYELD